MIFRTVVLKRSSAIQTEKQNKKERRKTYCMLKVRQKFRINLDLVQLLRRCSASSFSMNDSEQGIFGGYLRKDEEGLKETIIIKANYYYSLCWCQESCSNPQSKILLNWCMNRQAQKQRFSLCAMVQIYPKCWRENVTWSETKASWSSNLSNQGWREVA